MPKGIRQTLKERLINFVRKDADSNDDCWHFTGAKNNIGYGMIKKSHKDGMMTAHKAMFEVHNNTTVPHDKVVMHTCTSYDCINPDHLQLGTRKEVTRLLHDRYNSGEYKKYKIMTKKCNYCDMETTKGMITRWHDDNCKHKPKA